MPADLAIVVLAAGKGTRLKSGRAKVLHQAGGLPLIAQVLRSLTPLTRGSRASTAGVWVVVGHQADAVRAAARRSGCAEREVLSVLVGRGQA